MFFYVQIMKCFTSNGLPLASNVAGLHEFDLISHWYCTRFCFRLQQCVEKRGCPHLFQHKKLGRCVDLPMRTRSTVISTLLLE